MATLLAAAALAGCSGAAAAPDAAPAADAAWSPARDAAVMADLAADVADAAVAPTVSVPALSCADALDAVYLTPAGLPPMTPSTRGDVVRCAFDSTLPLATVQSQVGAKGVTTAMKSGVALYRVAFRTVRGDGSAGVSTARLYLPAAPAALPLPALVVGHPTDGLAAGCAPSKDATSNRDLALPWAGLGYAVIVPDYAGLGNEGVQSYLDNRDQAHAILDGARALRKLLPAAALSARVLAIGYSQGGGAVLSAQALASGYGADGELVGVVVFAPQWPTRLNSFGYVDQLRHPDALTISTGISQNVVTVMRTFAYFYNRVGVAHAGDGFPAGQRSAIDNAVTTLCQTPLGGFLQATATHVGDLFDPALRVALLACIDGTTGCVEPARSFYQALVANLVSADPAGAPVLYVQGLADYVMPAASEAACNIDKLHGDGVRPQVCVDALADHQGVVGRNMDFALGWASALLDGAALPACSGAGLPACTP